MMNCESNEVESEYSMKMPENNKNSSITKKSSSETTEKPLHRLYSSTVFQRQDSIKNLYSSSFKSMVSVGISFKSRVRKVCSIFESTKHPPNTQSLTKSPKLLLPADSNFIPYPISDSPFRLPGTEDRVVVYFTSLRGIRRTFQDCHDIRMIFKGFRVRLDERDISMDATYRKELQKVLGESNVSLPQIFIKGKYIGGGDVVKQLLEGGELVIMIKGLPLMAPKPCEACDDVRFVLCTNCNGSQKFFDEEMKSCPECNENGLVRCPLCCE
ncbi:glutaredoxin domain-containing cysteine-rich 1-like [Olea europaea subsp. europaea]|uniref:Glutaredoxin domain-containing cysteine-rich 1-like n=1 Tax=Olea europaea subsp. europaea TaxID=158383 RepID=A0A8S0RTG8_OLEEU|nr:glutaredoxin domain-containing cysteine-rich 1-like [Olea europaea subsp. europaea]